MNDLAALDQHTFDAMDEQINAQLGMQSQQQHTQHGMVVEFYMHSVQDQKKSDDEGRPVWGEVPYVMIRSPGQNSQIVRRPVRTGQHPTHDNNRFHNEYVAFVQQKDQPFEGTPLTEWPVLNASQVKELAHFGIKSVEHLANLNDANAQNAMGLADLKTKAKRWLESIQTNGPVAKLEADLKERDNKISTLEQAMKEMQSELKKLKKRT